MRRYFTEAIGIMIYLMEKDKRFIAEFPTTWGISIKAKKADLDDINGIWFNTMRDSLKIIR